MITEIHALWIDSPSWFVLGVAAWAVADGWAHAWRYLRVRMILREARPGRRVRISEGRGLGGSSYAVEVGDVSAVRIV
ncbi:hypothetical protein ACWEKT_06395 [Nocardia takedensis]